jgi:tRNA threonylcarbamoyladenosine biosynthesis protein TsaE
MTLFARHLTLADEAATTRLAGCLAPRLGAGDCLLLSGDIGAGKTSFARALIRARLGHPREDVPSPSFTLVQTYDAGDVVIWHVDLYRLSGPDGALELGLDAAFDQGLCLIEWPDRLGEMAPPGALSLAFVAGTAGHAVTISGPALWLERLEGCLDDA